MANVAPDHNVRTPGPGAASTRTDLSGQKQPIRVPTGLPYGAAQQMKNQEQAAAIPTTSQMTPGAAPGQAPQGQPGQPTDPRDIMNLVGSHQTDFPHQPLAPDSAQRGPIQDPQQTIAMLENLMHNAKTVDPRILNLYLQLRGQGAQEPQPNVPLGTTVEGWQLL